MLVEKYKVDSPNVVYAEDSITANIEYHSTELSPNGDSWVVKPTVKKYQFKTDTKLPKLGMMLVGLGGNNGSTLTAGIIANREGITWKTSKGVAHANYFGSLLQVGVVRG